jgi:hypothetical protein
LSRAEINSVNAMIASKPKPKQAESSFQKSRGEGMAVNVHVRSAWKGARRSG